MSCKKNGQGSGQRTPKEIKINPESYNLTN
jgi:hypothetical protein